jgi:hypothetical protein
LLPETPFPRNLVFLESFSQKRLVVASSFNLNCKWPQRKIIIRFNSALSAFDYLLRRESSAVQLDVLVVIKVD